MKENAPKKTWFQTLRTLWVPLAIGVVTVAALAAVVGMVWKDYRTAMMDSQTRQMELVVQSTADSIRVLLEEYADRLDSIAEKAEAGKAFRPTVARSDTIRDVWLENSNGEVIYSCYGLSAVCDVPITRTEDISYWQYHSGGEHYLVMKRKAGDETVCLVVDSTVMYQQLISEIHVGRNGYIMIKNDDNLVVMHPEAVQWGIKVVEGRQRIYQGKELDMSSLSELLRAQKEEESGTLDYYSYWWSDPALPRVHKISAFRHLDVGDSFWIVSAVVDYDDFYEPVQQSFVKVALIFGGVALVLVLFMFQMFRLQERDRRMTIMTTCFIPCGAKLPIIAMFAGAFFGGSGTIAFSAYVLGVLSIIISGIMLKKFKIFTGDPAPFVMELPSYHVPTAGNVFRSMWERGSSFIKKAGTVILLSTIFMWFTLGYGWENGAFCAVTDIDNSIMARIGSVIAPIFTLPGFGTWKSTVAAISGLVAKENVVATFGQLYHFAGEVAEDGSEIWGELAADFTQVGAYAFMAFNLLCAPCFAAMGAIKREMNNGKWTAFAIGYMCAYAYVVSTIIYQIGGLITGELTFGIGTVVAIVFIALIIFLLVRKPAKADSTDGLRRMSVDAH